MKNWVLSHRGWPAPVAIALILFTLIQPAVAQNIAGIGSVNDDLMIINGRSHLVMQLGSAPQNQPGITFAAPAFKEPSGFGGGSVRWLQTCVPDRWREDNNGLWTHLTSNGPCLDPKFPADSDNSGHANDTPAIALDPNYKVETVYDEYTTMFMYRPNLPNAIWVPLLSYRWYWTGKSIRTGSTWKLTNEGTSGYPHPNLHPNVPTWTATLQSLSYK